MPPAAALPEAEALAAAEALGRAEALAAAEAAALAAADGTAEAAVLAAAEAAALAAGAAEAAALAAGATEAGAAARGRGGGGAGTAGGQNTRNRGGADARAGQSEEIAPVQTFALPGFRQRIQARAGAAPLSLALLSECIMIGHTACRSPDIRSTGRNTQNPPPLFPQERGLALTRNASGATIRLC